MNDEDQFAIHSFHRGGADFFLWHQIQLKVTKKVTKFIKRPTKEPL